MIQALVPLFSNLDKDAPASRGNGMTGANHHEKESLDGS